MGQIILLIFVIFMIFAIYSGVRNIIQGLGGELNKRPELSDEIAVAELERLGDLYERGLLSVEEFQDMKRKIIKY